MPAKPSRSSRQPVEADLIVGQNLRKLRIDNNVTLSELAAAIGVSHQQLQKYETGANRISAGNLFQIAEQFSVPVDALFEGLEGRGGKADDPVERSRRKCHRLIDSTDSVQRLEDMSRVLRVLSV